MSIGQFLVLVFIGITSGCLSGFLGLGGGIIIIPMLVYLLGYSQQAAQGTTLGFLVLPVGIFAALQYYKAGDINLPAVIIISLVFIPVSYLASKYATNLDQNLLRKLFAFILVVVAIKMFLQK